MSQDQGPLMGRLSKERFGASMPVDAPYYQSPPFYYRDATSMTISPFRACRQLTGTCAWMNS